MKELELRAAATCAVCEKKIGASGLPLFWRVEVRRYGVKLDAVARQDGLAALVGSSAVARAMGADEDMATQIADTVTITVCETCGTLPVLVAELAELGGCGGES